MVLNVSLEFNAKSTNVISFYENKGCVLIFFDS